MADLPIPFSAPMVRALFEGRKTQTRRVLKPQPAGNAYRLAVYDPEKGAFFGADDTCEMQRVRIPYAPGDRLYVREDWRCSELWDKTRPLDLKPRSLTIAFAAGGSIANQNGPDDWRPSPISYDGADWMGRSRRGMHLPRWASRLTLTVTDVRVQRLQDISEADAVAEGVEQDSDGWRDYLMPETQCCGMARESFRTLWNCLHGADAWDINQWVAAYSFTVQLGNIDLIGARDA